MEFFFLLINDKLIEEATKAFQILRFTIFVIDLRFKSKLLAIYLNIIIPTIIRIEVGFRYLREAFYLLYFYIFVLGLFYKISLKIKKKCTMLSTIQLPQFPKKVISSLYTLRPLYYVNFYGNIASSRIDLNMLATKRVDSHES